MYAQPHASPSAGSESCEPLCGNSKNPSHNVGEILLSNSTYEMGVSAKCVHVTSISPRSQEPRPCKPHVAVSSGVSVIFSDFARNLPDLPFTCPISLLPSPSHSARGSGHIFVSLEGAREFGKLANSVHSMVKRPLYNFRQM